jgi:nucleoside-diphosphate-sugar epimerase
LSDLARKRILVVGAGGFVGANLVRALHRAGSEVVGFIRPGSQPARIADLESSIALHEVDVLRSESVAAAVDHVRPVLAVNLVVAGTHPETSAERLRQLEVSVLGTARLVEELARVGCTRLVHLGSSLEYGKRSRPLREDDELTPQVARGVAKAAETIACVGLARVCGLSVVILRPFSVYGPWERGSRLVPTAIRAALEGTELPLTHPRVVHDFVYVDDVVRAILLALVGPASLDGRVFNIGTGTQTTNEELVEIVGRAAGMRIRTVPGSHPARGHDTHVWVADNHLADELLGWAPVVDLEAGIRKTVSWYTEFDRPVLAGS